MPDVPEATDTPTGDTGTETQNTAAGEGQAPEAGQEGVSEGSSGSAEGTSAPAPSPEFLTSQQFQEAMGQYSGRYQQQLDQLKIMMQRMGQLFQAQRNQAASPQQQQSPLPDIYTWLQQGGTPESYKLLQGIKNEYESKIGQLEKRFSSWDSKSREQAEAQRIYDAMSQQTEQAKNLFPELQKDPELMEDLTDKVVSSLHRFGPAKTNVIAIAKAMVERERKRVERMYQEKLKAAAQNAEKPPVAPKSGAPTKSDEKAGKSYAEDPRAAFDRFQSDLKAVAASGEGPSFLRRK